MPPSDADEGSDGELLFDFRDIHKWDLAAGNLSPDREAAVTGDVSAHLNRERDPVLWIDRTGLDLDLTDRRLSIVGRIHSPEPLQAVDVIVIDVDGNRMRFRTRFFKTGPETEFEEIMRYVADRRAAGELNVITLSDLAALQGR